MPDCSGYDIGVDISLCVDGPVGNGSTAVLTITLANATGINAPNPFNNRTFTTSWNGRQQRQSTGFQKLWWCGPACNLRDEHVHTR